MGKKELNQLAQEQLQLLLRKLRKLCRLRGHIMACAFAPADYNRAASLYNIPIVSRGEIELLYGPEAETEILISRCAESFGKSKEKRGDQITCLL
ncbi:beta-lactamase class C 6-aminohexanoate-dimer hydrolase [Corchorus capsularis]|uniref:Beta-lactamase class C 6-aminohexanoate-dimer hydrolase n=1 Tax=Corchorus capsularis TaxID=210143 RepID=A0A1R3FXV9_COCAP|nr:beta-lactamase class C 6-aminohexanoate-dimer hydrolase [Corchorus capsularis]